MARQNAERRAPLPPDDSLCWLERAADRRRADPAPGAPGAEVQRPVGGSGGAGRSSLAGVGERARVVVRVTIGPEVEKCPAPAWRQRLRTLLPPDPIPREEDQLYWAVPAFERRWRRGAGWPRRPFHAGAQESAAGSGGGGAPVFYCPPPRLMWEPAEARPTFRRMSRWLRGALPVLSLLGCTAIAYTVLRSEAPLRGGLAATSPAPRREGVRYFLDDQEVVRDRQTGAAVGMRLGNALIGWE